MSQLMPKNELFKGKKLQKSGQICVFLNDFEPKNSVFGMFLRPKNVIFGYILAKKRLF